MKKTLINGVNFIENNFSLESNIKDKLLNETKNNFVSFFKSVADKTPTNISIDDALAFIKSEKLLLTINRIRSLKNKSERDTLKKTLPCITVSGIFKNGHSSKDFIKHSGLMQVDIDEVKNPNKLKQRILKDSFTLSCFISPSGNGVKAIIKIPIENHLESFQLIKDYFLSEYQIQIDAKCKDISRLMYLSYDNEIFINKNSLIMNKTALNVKNVISEIEKEGIDITEPYENWLKIGFAFANEFNESGRVLFHCVSKNNIKYEHSKCNKQYDDCLKSEKKQTTIKSFFYLAKQKGIKIKINKESIDEKSSIIITKDEKNEMSKFVQVENFLNKKYDFRLNIVSNEIEIKEKEETNFKSFVDANLYRYLQHNNISFSLNNLSALFRSDFVKQYDPIKYYFENVPQWDNKTDHIFNLCKFIKVKDQERFNRHFKKMLVRCVTCGLGKSFNKQAFILMGGQSSGKTTLCRWLCPDSLKAYYTENISTDKDSQISLTDNFIINLDELATMQKMELNALKSMLSKDKVKVRRPYDKKPSIAKRRANFFGSTNKDEFLNDETGSVRWLCFEILEIIWTYKEEIEIDLIWSQANSLYQNGFKYELTTEEIEENENVNSHHTIRTAEFELLQTYFEPLEKGKVGAEHLTATDILTKLRLSGIAPNNISVANIGKALKQLGVKQVNERIGEQKTPRKVYWLKYNYPTTPTTSL